LKLDGEDLFVKVLRTLRHADAGLIRNTTHSMMKALLALRRDLFLPSLRLYVAIDDAPVATDYLYDMYTFFKGIGNVTGIIISGTGLSEEVMDHHNRVSAHFPIWRAMD
jgi:hypothetical protein